MSATMKISFLGGIEVSGPDRSRVSSPSRAVTLLAYLVSHPGTPQPRGYVAGLLWPESDNAQARTNLRRELHHLRSLVGGTGCLRPESGSLSWHPGPDCDVDVEAFVQAKDHALAAVAADDRHAVDRHVSQALRHYQGPFLLGVDDDWALAVRDDLEQACVDLCDQVVSYYEATGDPTAGIPPARRRIQLQPLEEPGYLRLMKLQRAAGDRAGAMGTYHHCASVLERELGVTPSPATQREFDAAFSERAAADRAGSTAGPRGPTWSAAPALVGRGAEQAWLLAAWERAASRCQMVILQGDAGIGKTRMVTDLAASVQRGQGVVASGRCFAATGTIPLAPVAEWLRSPYLRLATKRLDPVWRAEVDRLVPDGDRALDSSAGPRAKVDAWQRLRFFEGLARAVLVVDRPLLLTLDDLQWCDKATLSWLAFLKSFAPSAPVLIVATARKEELARSDLAGAVATMRAAGQVRHLEVGSLSSKNTGTLAAQLLGRPVSSAELSLIVSVTNGNPFYVIEALREAVSRPEALQPGDLHSVLNSRLSRLAEPAQQVAALASAVRRDFSLDLLIEASDLDADTVVSAVDDLWRSRILVQQGRGYDFAHDLIREAAYGSVSPPRRWLLHRRLAQALELMFSDRLDTVAGQLAEQHDLSGRTERALPFYETAARQAASVYAHAEAVRLWQHCLDLLRELPPSRRRDEHELEVLQHLMPPLNAWRGYAFPELEAFERRAAELGRHLRLVDAQGAAAIALFATTFVQGRTAESHRWGQDALAASEQCPELAGQAHLAVAGSALSLGLVRLSDRHFRLACELADDTDSLPIGTRTSVHARCWWAHALWLSGHGDEAKAASVQAVDQARHIAHPYSHVVALAYAAITDQMCDDTASLREVLAELSHLCERHGFAYYRDWATVLSGWLQGGPAGLRVARGGIASLQRDGCLARMPYWLWLVADVHRREGNRDEGIAVLDAAASFAISHDDRWWLPEVLRTRAALETPARARITLEKAAALALTNASPALHRRCAADLARAGAGPAGNPGRD